MKLNFGNMNAFKYLVFGIIVSTLLSSKSVYCQLILNGKPFSWNLEIDPNIATFSTPKMNNEFLSAKYNQDKFNKSFQFGEEFNLHLDIIKNASQILLPDGGLLYQYKIFSKGAISLNFIFSQFEVKKGSFMYISDQAKNEFTGAYSFLNMNEQGILGTDLIKTDCAIIEIYEPKNNIGSSKVVLSQIIHGFQDADEHFAKALGGSGSCNYDVNCPIGSDFQDQKNGVALTISGGLACSGTLVYNTSGTAIPYYLTARHCGTSTTGSWVLRFNWERAAANAICGTTNSTSNDNPITHTVTGAQLKASSDYSDFTLVKLNFAPDASWNIFYNGWDRTDLENVSDVTVIHHPMQDIKKISKSNIAPYKWSTPFNGASNCQMWRVDHWTQGVTEQGSSGSPLFNQDKRIIGVLSGGSSSCNGTLPNNGFDGFGRFGIAWDTFSDSTQQLKYWLDPLQTNAPYIDGAYPNVNTPYVDITLLNLPWLQPAVCEFNQPYLLIYNNGNISINSAKIRYSFNGIKDSLLWSGNLLPYHSDTVFINFPISLNGNVIFSAEVISNTLPTETALDNNFINAIFNFSNTNNKRVNIEFGFDYYTSEISWDLVSSDNPTTIIDSHSYAVDGISSPVYYSNCLPEGCYQLIINDSNGDGWFNYDYTPGYLKISNNSGNILNEIQPANANFGGQITIPFCLGALSTQDLEPSSFSIYPNPAHDNITIKSSLQHPIQHIFVTNLEGKIIQNYKSLEAESLFTFTPHLQPGVYLIKVQIDYLMTVQKLVIY